MSFSTIAIPNLTTQYFYKPQIQMYCNRIGRRERGTMKPKIFWNRLWIPTYTYELTLFFKHYCNRINIRKMFSWNRVQTRPIRLHEVFDSIVKGLSTIVHNTDINYSPWFDKNRTLPFFFHFSPLFYVSRTTGSNHFCSLRNFQTTEISECLI